MTLTFSIYARKKIRELDRETRKFIGAEIRKYQNGEPVDIKKLKGAEDRWRIAVGDWRIMIRVDKEKDPILLTVTDITPRKDAYR